MTFPVPVDPRLARLIIALPVAGALVLSLTAARPIETRTPVPAPLFANGGFENPAIPASSFTRFGAGNRIGLWNVTDGNVDLIGAGFWQAMEGHQSLDLEGDDSGAVEQPLFTRFGGCYTVRFALAGDPDGGPALKRGYARITQNTVGHPSVQKNFAFETTGRTRANMGYVRQRFHFRALAPTVVLRFAGTTGGGHGPVIDDVTVTHAKPVTCRLRHSGTTNTAVADRREHRRETGGGTV